MKKLVFVTEARFITDANGIIYADASFSNDLWNRYLKVFDHLYVLARVKKDDKFVPNKESVIDLDTVSFIEIPYYVGPLEYLKKKTAIKKRHHFAIIHFTVFHPFCLPFVGTVSCYVSPFKIDHRFRTFFI